MVLVEFIEADEFQSAPGWYGYRISCEKDRLEHIDSLELL